MIRISLVLIAIATSIQSIPADEPHKLDPLVRVVDLDVGESVTVELSSGAQAELRLVSLKEKRDPVREAVRRAAVTVEVNGETAQLVAATYNLPTTVGGVRIDCSVTKGYNSNTSRDWWGLEKDARLRLWPKDSPLLRPGTFKYPAQQRWFASDTQMANVPTFVNGGEDPNRNDVYYHSGLDIGGSEGLVQIVAATDGLVVSAGEQVLDGHNGDTPVAERYDVVYLLDARGWYYRYSHLKEIDSAIKPGRFLAMGEPIGILGKEGGSGGWSHLHFNISARQPSGKWGVQAGYAFLWEAYLREFEPNLIAVARPHHFVRVGDTATLDATKSYSAAGKVQSYEWQFGDGTTAEGPITQQTYPKPGTYSEVLKITDDAGNVDFDFAVVQVIDPEHLDQLPPTIHAAYYPTFGIQPGDDVTFKVRTFRTTEGHETWDFGDGSPEVRVQSDGNVRQHNPDGYAVTTHNFAKPGHYVVRVERTNDQGISAVAHLHVRVGE